MYNCNQEKCFHFENRTIYIMAKGTKHCERGTIVLSPDMIASNIKIQC